MPIRYPIEYALSPDEVPQGTHWVTLTIKNVGTTALAALDVRLHSTDPTQISVLGTGSYVATLDPDEERMLPFKITATGSGDLFAVVEGWKEQARFRWESPAIALAVEAMVAALVHVFAMAEPYPPAGETIQIEAMLRGLRESEGLTLELWAQAPSGAFEELATVETKPLAPGMEATYEAEVTPQERGAHTIYAYLYEDGRRIGLAREHIYVT